MRTFGTEGPVSPEKNYVVSRTTELTDFIDRIKHGKYLVIFAPRQTGKTTFFQFALDMLVAEDPTYVPIELNFEAYVDVAPVDFYRSLVEDIRERMSHNFQKRGTTSTEALMSFLDTAEITDHLSMLRFFQHLSNVLGNQKFVVVIIMRAFKQPINGLEREYLPEDTRAGFRDYLTPDGHIHMQALLDNFKDFIARAGFRILQIPDTPHEYVGQYLLFAYLDQLVHIVGGNMSLEVQTGRGRMDLLILHNTRKYIVETKIWEGDLLYEAGKEQLAKYLSIENVNEGYYVVFDHRKNPEPQVETQTLQDLTIRSYVIPVLQERPSTPNTP